MVTSIQQNGLALYDNGEPKNTNWIKEEDGDIRRMKRCSRKPYSNLLFSKSVSCFKPLKVGSLSRKQE